MIYKKNVELRVPVGGKLEANLPQNKTLDGKTIKAIYVSELGIDSKGGVNTNVAFTLTLKSKEKNDVMNLTKKMLEWGSGQHPLELDLKGIDTQSSELRFVSAPATNANLVLLFFYE